MTIVHERWKGAEYTSGIQGQRIGIVGYSHWNGYPDRSDYTEFTVDVIRSVISGKGSHAFFTQIRNYFDFDDHGAFWQKVLFFNYVPRCIGGPDERFDVADESWNDSANGRFREILARDAPDKVIVFTSKGWGSLPPFDGPLHPEFDSAGLAGVILRDPCGTYDASSKPVMTFGLRHPQCAPAKVMSQAVKQILKVPITAA